MSTFLTGINHQPPNKMIINNDSIKNQLDKTTTNQPTKPIIDLATKPMEKQVKIVEEKYLNYTIEQNTKYTDLEKVRQKFLALMIERYNIYNNNKIKIAELKKEYNTIIHKTHVEIIVHYIPGFESLYHYNNEIDKLKKLIRKKTYDQEVYKYMYDKLYHKNYLIKKRVQNELKYDSIINKQYSDYKIVQSHALMALSGQNQKLDLMREYYKKSVENNKKIILQKAKLINNLDYQIDIIKSKTKELDEKLKGINQNQIEIKKNLNSESKKFQTIKYEFLSQRKRFYCDGIKLRKMLSFAKLKTVDDLINCFNNKKGYIESLRTQCYVNNKLILKKQEELTKYQKEIEDIKIKIIEKEKSLQLKKYEMKTQIEITILTNKIENATLESNAISNQIKEKKCKLQSIVDFCRKGINKIIRESKHSKIRFYDTNSTNCFGAHLGYSYLLSVLLNKKKDVTLSFENFELNINNSIITICYLISIYSNFFAAFYYSVIDDIHKSNIKAEEIARYEEEQQNLAKQQKQYPRNNSSKINNSSNTHNKHPLIQKEDNVDIKELIDGQTSDKYYTNLNEMLYQLESKNKTMKLKEKELLSNLKINNNDNSEEDENKHHDNGEIKQNELYQNFMVYLNNEGVNAEPIKSDNKYYKIDNYKRTKRTKRIRQSYYIDAAKGRCNSLKNTTTNNNNVECNLSRSSTCFSTVHNKSFIHSHPKKVLEIIKKYQNELAQENNKSSIHQTSNPKKRKSFYISQSLSQKLLSRASSQRYMRNKKSSFDKIYNKQTFCYSNEEPDFSDEEEQFKGDEYYDDNDYLYSKKSDYRYFKDDPEFAAILKRINDLRILDLEYSKKESLNQKENPYEIFSNFERKYLKKDKLFLKRLKQLESNKENITGKYSHHRKDSNLLSSSKNESQLDNSYIVSQKKQNQVLNITQSSNKNQLLNNSLGKVFNISSNYLPN